MSQNQWLVFISFISFMFLGSQSGLVVAAFGVEMRTGRAEYLQGEEPVLIIKNQGPNTVSFGSYYWLQRHRDGDWVTIPFRENVGFPAWLMMLEPGKEYRERIRFGGLVEVPGEGRYRIAKELSIEEMDLTLIKYAEFYIRHRRTESRLSEYLWALMVLIFGFAGCLLFFYRIVNGLDLIFPSRRRS